MAFKKIRNELNIQSGDAMDVSEREYTQWTAEFTSQSDDRLAERIFHYVRGINALSQTDGES